MVSKEVINVNGEEKVVREDTAKAFRGVNWILLTVLAFIVIAAVLFFGGFLKSATDDKGLQNPAQIENNRH